MQNNPPWKNTQYYKIAIAGEEELTDLTSLVYELLQIPLVRPLHGEGSFGVEFPLPDGRKFFIHYGDEGIHISMGIHS